MALRRVLRIMLLAALVTLPAGRLAAQGCDDCEIIKRGVAGTAPAATAAPAVLAPLNVTPARPVVRIVLFWAEGCGHCHELLDGLLPHLQQKHGAQLEVRLVEVSSLEDVSAFNDIAAGYGYGRGEAAVPFLQAGDQALMGVERISAELPALVEALLAAGGADWPAPVQVEAGAAASQADDICRVSEPCATQPGAASAGGGAEVEAARGRWLGWGAGAVLGLVAACGIGLAVLRARRGRGRASG